MIELTKTEGKYNRIFIDPPIIKAIGTKKETVTDKYGAFCEVESTIILLDDVKISEIEVEESPEDIAKMIQEWKRKNSVAYALNRLARLVEEAEERERNRIL